MPAPDAAPKPCWMCGDPSTQNVNYIPLCDLCARDKAESESSTGRGGRYYYIEDEDDIV
jgi:hypothetical protein